MKGYFIVFEGPDGSGKSSVSQVVYKKLLDEGYPVILTREPGGIKISENIRDIILNPSNTKMDGRTEALLYAASRRQHLVEKVIPALNQGKIVLCDRFVDSSLAYQSYGRGLDLNKVKDINQFAIEDTYPDFTIFLDVPAQVGMDRIKDRNFKDRLDQENIDFHEQVFAGYQEILKSNDGQYHIIDASSSLEEVINQSLNIIKGNIDG
ncbi:MAG: dTMP kinase [Erysipelotrichaceae bacterium]